MRWGPEGKTEVERPKIRPTLRWNALRQEFELWDWPSKETRVLKQLKWHFDWNRKVWVTSLLERAQPFAQYADPSALNTLHPAIPKPLV